jgi:Ca-activated chloride channel family protein
VGSDLFAAGRATVADKDPQPDLADIARLTGGHHWVVRSAAEATAMARDVDTMEKTLAPPARHREVREWYLLPLLIAAACFVAAQVLTIRRQAA